MSATQKIYLMGTVITVTIDHPQAEQLLAEVERRLRIYEHRFSANDPTSELMRLATNAGRCWTVVNSELYDLIALGKTYSLLPNSNLNIALGPLVQQWRIGFDDAHVPTDAAIKQALTLTDPHQIELDQQRQAIYLTTPGMTLDLGSLAKGYIADLLATYLRQQHVQRALLNLGGNVVALTDSADGDQSTPWQIGLRDPQGDQSQLLGTVALSNQSLVTSGIYERQLQVNGHRYHHIFDKRTGYPIVTDLASVSIKSPQSVDGELWTTMLFGKSASDILGIVAAMPGIECCLVSQTGQIYQSAHFGLVQNSD
ncbi:FAD:protein FMN transferase [Lapidilactobacillus wuchangensis]|uniref:FAD:protein FMN transferase n=1 Tax=Lapidilactobacillus wuchangensis TaxID=2486001 RepID=UPI000F798BC5|nr:FAD:protein FMN transferase [Lapidilactobacillus wuchangensis]